MPPLIELRHVTKDYRGLRPLRIDSFTLAAGERVAISGLDAVAAEVFVNLVTAAVLPDAGDVRIFGESTRDIATETAWLTSLDRFGILTERAVLLEGSSLLQNMALPFTVEIDPVPDAVEGKVKRLATAVGLEDIGLDQPMGNLPRWVRLRVHLARALATDPQVLLLEHPSAGLDAAEAAGLARQVTGVATDRRLAVLCVTQDAAFAVMVADRRLALNAANGTLTAARGFSWFR